MIAVGAILAFAVTGEIKGINIEIVGWILLAVGAFGLLLSLLLMSRRRRETYALYDPYDQGPPG